MICRCPISGAARAGISTNGKDRTTFRTAAVTEISIENQTTRDKSTRCTDPSHARQISTPTKKPLHNAFSNFLELSQQLL